MPSTGISRLSILLPVLLILVGTFDESAYGVVGEDLRTISASGGSIRSLLASQRKSDQVLDCGELASKSQCSQKPKCRWCRSEALDDMCFSKLEARRLPSQVFSCD